MMVDGISLRRGDEIEININGYLFRLDEKAILYGRTGKMPGDELEPKVSKKPLTTPSNSLDLNSSQRLEPPKTTQSYAILSGESLRSLSPAEQVKTIFTILYFYSSHYILHINICFISFLG